MLLSLALLLPVLSIAAIDKDTEAVVLAAIDSQSEQALQFLEKVVNLNSGTLNPDGVRQVAELYAKEFEALGFAANIIEQPPAMGRGPHLVARRSGQRGKKLLLIGHLDTVFEPDSAFQSMHIEDGKAYGPGVEDMKGGNNVVLYALKALHSADALHDTDITVVFTGDEEAPGEPLSQARHVLIEAGRRADIALGFEAGVDELRIATIARRGFSGWLLEVKARPAHSSQIFQPGYGAGAIFEVSRILNEFYQQLAAEEYLTFNPGAIVGGTSTEFDTGTSRGSAFGKSNVIAETATVSGDLRFLTNTQRDRARRRMQAIVASSLPETQASIRFKDGYPGMAPTAANQALMATLGEVLEDLGMGRVEALDPSRRGAADISFVAADVEASMAGLGPVGWGGHTVKEGIDLATLVGATNKAALLIYRLTR
jgi:glutamate carboxypeptidase